MKYGALVYYYKEIWRLYPVMEFFSKEELWEVLSLLDSPEKVFNLPSKEVPINTGILSTESTHPNYHGRPSGVEGITLYDFDRRTEDRIFASSQNAVNKTSYSFYCVLEEGEWRLLKLKTEGFYDH